MTLKLYSVMAVILRYCNEALNVLDFKANCVKLIEARPTLFDLREALPCQKR